MKLIRRLSHKLTKTVTPETVASTSQVSLRYWRPLDGRRNFGDELGRVVTTLMLARQGLTVEDESRRSCHLLSVGSILHFAQDGDVVWGSGRNGKIDADKHLCRELDVRAVRGPLTRAFLTECGVACPEIYGDPALLLPGLLPLRRAEPKHEIGFVPNLNDLRHGVVMPDEIARLGMHLISPYLPWRQAIEQILSCRAIVSSSLHGVVIAEAYGIDACLVKLSEHELPFKYQDYFAGTQRPDQYIADTIEAARSALGTLPRLSFDPKPLMEAFPYDLWLD